MAKNEKEKINASKGTSTNLHPSSEQEGFRIPPPPLPPDLRPELNINPSSYDCQTYGIFLKYIWDILKVAFTRTSTLTLGWETSFDQVFNF